MKPNIKFDPDTLVCWVHWTSHNDLVVKAKIDLEVFPFFCLVAIIV